MEWLLPDGIEAITADEAESLEKIRRAILELFSVWGYRLVIPPLVEFCDSLFADTGRDLDLQTLKLIDQASGRLMGVRADITPQVARIDAKQSVAQSLNRLCYVGTVLHARADRLEGTRSPMQIGAELYGHFGAASDLEIIRLMLSTLELSGLTDVHLDIGHVGIYRTLAKIAGLSAEQESSLFEAIQRKDHSDLAARLDGLGISDTEKEIFRKLPELNGPAEKFESVVQDIKDRLPAIAPCLEEIRVLIDGTRKLFPKLPINFDLAELRGYRYQTGIVFAAFVPGLGREIARGGRYLGISNAESAVARPATGFSTDLKVLIRQRRDKKVGRKNTAVFAPFSDCPLLGTMISSLRAAGTIVIQELPGQQCSPADLGCAQEIIKIEDQWEVQPL